MAAPKSDLFDETLQEQANLFKALAHPARLHILHFLAETKGCISGDLSEELPLGRTTVNQHLKELKNAGLIHGTICGTKTNYCLNYPKIEKMNNLFNDFLFNFDLSNAITCKK